MPFSRQFFLQFTAVLMGSMALTGCGGSGSALPSNGGTNGSVKVTPAAPKMGVGANLQFEAAVTGMSNAAVNWEVNGISGGDSSVGTIDAAGFYIAPDVVPSSGTVTVTAVSAGNSSESGSSVVTLSAADPLGTVSSSHTITCPTGAATGVPNATCYQLDVQCPSVADFTTYLKVNQPSGPPVGTVMFGTGTGGSNLYDLVFLFGTEAVQTVLSAGFTAVQVSFGEPFTHSTATGWMTGPGGVRRLACRYATTAQWVYQHIHNANTGAPLCATGNSGGSAAITYGITHYGLDSIFSMVEPTSGPPMARLDTGCICSGNTSVQTACGNGQLSLCYDNAAATLIDQAYGPSSHVCSQATGNQAQFLSDSVDGPGANFNYPKTDVQVVFGGKDISSAVPQGTLWLNSVKQAGSANISFPLAPACVASAPHAIPDDLEGAQQIASDIKTRCKLQ